MKIRHHSTESIPDKSDRRTDLSHQTLGALLWTFSGSGILFVLRTIIIIILARLLTPADFGVLAAALTVVQFSEIFALLGVGPAVVQRPEIEERHLRTGFTFSVLFGVFLSAVIWLIAPDIAKFYQSEEITAILRTIVFVFPLSGLTVVAESLLQRNLQFRKLAGIEVAAYTVGSGIIGISLALLDFGVWALVASYLAQVTLKAIALLIAQPHAKKPQFELTTFKELLYFGAGFTIAKVMNYLALQGDNLVIGRWLGVKALGLYGRAYTLMTTPVTLLGGVLERVLFPAMAKVQSEPERLITAYRKGNALIALTILPISIVSYLLAPEIINVLLGPAWNEVVMPFRLLAIGMLFRTGYMINATLARAKGAVYRNAWRQGIYAALIIGGAWIGQHWGISGVALGVLIALAVHFLLMAQLGLSMLPSSFSWRQLLSIHLPGIRCSVVIGMETWAIAMMLRELNLPPMQILFACAIVILMTILLFVRFAPNLILGIDGISVLRMLANRLPRQVVVSLKLKNIEDRPVHRAPEMNIGQNDIHDSKEVVSYERR